jgi:hypothetical protein
MYFVFFRIWWTLFYLINIYLNDTKNRTKRSSITNNFWRNAIGYDHIHSVYAPYTIVYIVYTLRIRSPYFAVFLRIRSRSYTIVIRSHVFRRNTVVYGAYMTCIRSYTPSYTTVYDRIRSPYPSTWVRFTNCRRGIIIRWIFKLSQME